MHATYRNHAEEIAAAVEAHRAEITGMAERNVRAHDWANRMAEVLERVLTFIRGEEDGLEYGLTREIQLVQEIERALGKRGERE